MKKVVFKSRGFTLVELLAIIVILAILVLITVPIITNIVKESKKSALRETGREIIRAGETYRTMNQIGGTPINECVYFDFSKSIEEETVIDDKKYIPLKELNLKGKLPTKGVLELCSETQNLRASDGEYIVSGSKTNNISIVEGDIDSSTGGNTGTEEPGENPNPPIEEPNPPEITPPIISQIIENDITINSIQVIVNASDEEGIVAYLYSLDGENYIESELNSYTFTKLQTNTEYTVYVKVRNKSGKEAEADKKIKTKDVITITYTNTPSEVQNGYLKQQTVNITFNVENPSSMQYYIKTMKAGTSSLAVTESYGTGNMPGTKSTVSSRTSLTAGTWYKVSGNVSITYTAKIATSEFIYAVMYDGTSYSTKVSGSLAKIDLTSPTLTLGTAEKGMKSLTIPITKLEDTESGVGNVTCKYGTSSGSYTTNVTSVDTNSCVITGLTSGTTYYYQVCASDKAGNTPTCKTGNAKTGSMNVEIASTNTPVTSINEYLQKQIAKVTFTKSNITNAEYFVKTTKEGTSSVAVTQSCGTDERPGTCTTIKSATTLEPNTWYKVSGNINVTYYKTSDEPGTLYALTYDGINYLIEEKSVSKIDATGPTFTVTHASSADLKLQIMDMDDTGRSGVQSGSLTCQYLYVGVDKLYDASSVAETSCVLTDKAGTYLYKVCLSDKVGNQTCKSSDYSIVHKPS
ncbi:MAG: prepilin-type N-terminal cleavage/methylation domain-containing protein [Clostridium sp.]|nr:prepilin-type N-terminal cleavage/methylation domain-containing protein [Clostridium sp.]MCM1444610.1 prepilin-type N-terminal cleavage/methylation domain-containing protein [Candidatus Amulumruptor caecigallinarius]